MRTVLVVDRFDPLGGGLERWTARLAAHLLEAGHAVEVVTFAVGEHGLPVRVHQLPFARSVLARGRLIERCLAGLRPAVVHDTGSGWSGDVFHPQTGSHLGSLDREIASHPPLRRLKAAVSPRTNLRRWRLRRLEALQAARARRVVAVSHRIRRDLAARHGLSEERIAVIHNGADTARFAPERIGGLREAARRELGLAEGGVLFLGAAHNLRLKGMDTAMRALAALRAAGAEAHLAIAGGAADAHWTGLAAELGVADRVRFLGQVDEMAPLFAAADAFVHPTRWDACSLSTIEAAAAALPVITTAMNGAAELIRDGETGFVLSDPEDAGALAARMRLLLDGAARRRIGAAAHLAAQGHDIRDNLRAVESLLFEAAQPATP
ncbi:glycosyltransferase family 4 protein [Roseomonas sp. BN140053]|uniref:glycosyltransferase family 4 protein n=1 Tax=Roseomonas sp. BN140053 TaxID=3391898 RepID=UPI0039ECC95A